MSQGWDLWLAGTEALTMGVAEVPGPDLGCEIQRQLEPLEWEGQEGLGFQGHWDPSPKSAGSTWPLTSQAGLWVSS